ncbi:hypothetical protein CXB51_034612 [Gossypium anomalum]|uniref:Integrase catalytic domain-containing protein n=1 Tax=Gossypium anomalum TaxID=47600 RepID=A0A8J6CJ01_9ROSI|nr:hypothetical protein CXB51_034612 [Gossypium anomalum]
MSETPPTSEITSNPKNFSGSDAPSDSSGLTITCHRLNGNNFQGSCEGNLVIKDPEGNLSSTAFFSSQLTPNWILDSGATDHMTGNKALFHNFFHTFGKAVKTADGTLCKIEGHGTVILNEQIALKNVLLALNSKKMIGKASLHNGLYILPTSPKIEISKSFTALGKVDTVIDIWGPSRVKNADNCKWFITFIDDHSRITWTYLLKDKSETASVFVQFYNMVLTQFGSKIQLFKSDNGSEFFARSLGDFFKEKGIVQISSCVGTPQQNGIAEGKNRHLLEVTRSLLFTTNVPKYLWGKALLTATYLINRMPSKVLKFQTPQSIFLQHFPHFKPISSILPLKIFGCTVFIQNIAPNKSKLDPKSLKCVLVGYSSLKKGYKCYHPPSKRFFTTMDITFYEQDSYFTQAEIQGETWSDFQPQQVSPPNLHSQPSELPSCSPLPADLSPVNAPIDSPLRVYTRKRRHIPETVLQSDSYRELDLGPAAEMEEEISKSTTLDDFPIAIRKGVRQCTKHPIEKFTGYNSLMPSFQAFTATLDKEQVPTSIAEALKDPKWRRAVEEEICALEKNATWTITDLPQGKKAVGCKWIFAVKYNSNGSIQRYKARLVARGFTQTYGIDFTETFAPVAKLNTIRVLLSLAVNCDWKLHQLDVKNAFLNGKLEEEVYTQLPPGSKFIEGSNKVCKLNKSLYGLKQSPRAWFERFSKVILQNGYKQSLADHTLFIKVTYRNKKAILIVYVDDIILTGDDEEEISNLKKLLNREFETKDLGKLRYFLGMEVARSKEGLVINQRKYVLDLLKETGFLGCKPADIPMEANLRFNKEDGSLVDREKFQRLVGKLIYLSLTRPDIAFPVNVISQHMTNPTEEHMAAANRILKYLKKTPGHGLMFKKTQDRTVKIFTDSSWAGDLTERRSTSGYCTFVWGNLTTWRSKKQSEDHFEVLCDNQSAIQIAKNPVQHDRTKHVEIDRHFIADQVNKKTATLSYIPSEGQIANILTKALPKPVFNKFLFKLGLYNNVIFVFPYSLTEYSAVDQTSSSSLQVAVSYLKLILRMIFLISELLQRYVINVGAIQKFIMMDTSYDMLKLCQSSQLDSDNENIETSYVVGDEEFLPIKESSVDLVISCLGLHWTNDLPGAMIQCKLALKPDGLFLAAILGGETLKELRIACTVAQMEREGGISPRVSPLAQVRDAGNLLTRAGFALPGVDVDEYVVRYNSALDLIEHLRAMGETNALLQRTNILKRETALATAAIYDSMFAAEDGTIPATFQVLGGGRSPPPLVGLEQLICLTFALASSRLIAKLLTPFFALWHGHELITSAHVNMVETHSVKDHNLALCSQHLSKVIYMTGWREHPSQQKSKRRGSATISFKDIQKQFGNGS